MISENRRNETAVKLTQVIIEKGGNYEMAQSLIRNNPALLSLDELDFKRHIFFVMNSDSIYAVLLIINNDLFWTVLNKNECGMLIKSNNKDIDYVIMMMLESITKYRHITSHKEKTSLEDAINSYSLVKKNERSYHIK